LLKSLPLPNKPNIADVGTGSGALGITAALEVHPSHVDLFDIDASALAVAKHNCELHELHLKAYKRDLLARVQRPYDVILANLPYVPRNWHINQAAALEPRLAIDGGQDGLDVYRRLFEQLKKFSWQPRFILTEALPPQHEKLAEIAKAHGFTQLKTDDLIQVFKNN
jgi:release factor glutamine methyltransferase